MISHTMKHFQNGTRYRPLLHFLLDATIFTTINDEKEGNININIQNIFEGFSLNLRRKFWTSINTADS